MKTAYGRAAGLAMLLLAGTLAWAQDKTQNVDVKVGPKSGTRDTMTVVSPGPGGETKILSREVIKNDESGKETAAERQVAPTDTTPRKARVVVIPAIFAANMRQRLSREFFEQFGMTDPSIIENPGYTSHIINALVNTRKLDILERADLRSLTKEIDFGESEYADIEKAVKIGKMLNADYVVLPEIRVFVVTLERQQVPYVGQGQVKVKGKFGTTVRTVDVATSKIVASHLDEVNRIARIREKDTPAIVVSDLITGMYSESALKEGANIVDVAYPIRVVSIIDDDNLIINRGEGAVMKDEILKVYQTGEVMVDPDTKDNLGYHEAYLGKLKITEVNEKTSKAVVLEKKGPISKLSICRREKIPSNSQPVPTPAPRLD